MSLRVSLKASYQPLVFLHDTSPDSPVDFCLSLTIGYDLELQTEIKYFLSKLFFLRMCCDSNIKTTIATIVIIYFSICDGTC